MGRNENRRVAANEQVAGVVEQRCAFNVWNSSGRENERIRM